MILVLISTIMFLTANATTSKLEIRNLGNDPLLLIKRKECKIVTGVIKVVHPINLTVIAESITKFNNMPKSLDKKLPLTKIATRRVETLMYNFYEIKPLERNKKKRWDTLGAAWKWLAGSPDAGDLRLINTSMNELISANNLQVQINDMLNVGFKSWWIP